MRACVLEKLRDNVKTRDKERRILAEIYSRLLRNIQACGPINK